MTPAASKIPDNPRKQIGAAEGSEIVVETRPMEC